jgi:hypothetical protein
MFKLVMLLFAGALLLGGVALMIALRGGEGEAAILRRRIAAFLCVLPLAADRVLQFQWLEGKSGLVITVGLGAVGILLALSARRPVGGGIEVHGSESGNERTP